MIETGSADNATAVTPAANPVSWSIVIHCFLDFNIANEIMKWMYWKTLSTKLAPGSYVSFCVANTFKAIVEVGTVPPLQIL